MNKKFYLWNKKSAVKLLHRLRLFRKRSGLDDNLISKWSDLCHDLGLTDGQILGLAYLNAAIPSVLADVQNNEDILKPLRKVVEDTSASSSRGANLLYLYRELYHYASARNAEVLPIDLEGLPGDFFEGNRYLGHVGQDDDLIANSRLTLLLAQSLGRVLSDFDVGVKMSFELGNAHSNFFLNTENCRLRYCSAVITSNQLPHYLALAIEAVPDSSGFALRKDVWIFSKILRTVLKDSVLDHEFSEWVWSYHNTIFYVDKVDSMEILDKWSLDDADFGNEMIREVNRTAFAYYNGNKRVGLQKIGQPGTFRNAVDFFPILNERMRINFNVNNPTRAFICRGESCNYLVCRFIATIQIVLECREFRASSV